MTAIILIIIIACAISGRTKRHAPRDNAPRADTVKAPPPPVKAAPKPPERPKASAATLAALDDARQSLQQQLDIVKTILDSAPPEKQRIQLLRQQATIYNQLANIESKIYKAGD